jgi:CheY-like chemotaxis protein
MIQEYYYEIIAMIAVSTLIVIYFLNQKFKQQEQDFPAYNPNKKPKKETKPIHLEEHEEIVTSQPYVLPEDSGSFGEIAEDPFDANPSEPTTSVTKREIAAHNKTPVPPHAKITKEDFKEFAGVKILLAEDNVINQKVIQGLLQESGIELRVADDGKIALEILEKEKDFDIILMDVHMPNLDGFETTQTIRLNPEYDHIAIVALSGDIAVDDVRKMIEAGMQEHLQKPLRMDDFYDILYSYTKSSTIYFEDSAAIIKTKELNGQKGLEICGGDENFYRDILREFILTYTNTSHKLLEFLRTKDLLSADELLLDFIGISANIGADNIKNIALELKLAIRDSKEKSYMTILDDFDVHLERLIKDIESCLKH